MGCKKRKKAAIGIEPTGKCSRPSDAYLFQIFLPIDRRHVCKAWRIGSADVPGQDAVRFKPDTDDSEPLLSSIASTGLHVLQAAEPTMEKFNKINTGMSFDDVTDIMGKRYEVLSETEFAGIKTIMLSWKSTKILGANMNVTFQDGKVISKAQFGLK